MELTLPDWDKDRGAFGARERKHRYPGATMRKMPLLPVLVLCVVTLAQGEVSGIKLCGREFIRAVVYTCGGSRWRRILSEPAPQDVSRLNQVDFDWLSSSAAVPHYRRDLSERLTVTCCQEGCRRSDLAFFC